MASKSNEWRILFESKKVVAPGTTYLNVSIGETVDGERVGEVNLRKWAKYVKKDEKALGMKKDDMIYRPSTQGVTFPYTAIPFLIAELQAAYDFALKNGIITNPEFAGSYLEETPAAKKPRKKA